MFEAMAGSEFRRPIAERLRELPRADGDGACACG